MQCFVFHSWFPTILLGIFTKQGTSTKASKYMFHETMEIKYCEIRRHGAKGITVNYQVLKNQRGHCKIVCLQVSFGGLMGTVVQ